MASLTAGTRISRSAPDRRHPVGERQTGWEGAALRMLEFVAYPALAGCALLLLCLGVVTWLPALAAAAYALRQWRDDGRPRPFLDTLEAFGRYWRRLWRHALLSTVAGLVLVANVVFLTTRPGVAALALLALQIGLVLASVPYHLALAVTAARDPGGDVRRWCRGALLFAFAAPRRGLALLAVAIAAPVLTAPLAVGPLLLGGTLPLLVGLWLADRPHPCTPPDRKRKP
ncbi:DUF624 domain-containing protein [Micromonospora marina]|uniref:Uncharacterized membrane protein YesL n=1 Tax=Micromonospora marina TaxID=307120 RepID=A0A1C4ZCL2_9ACTN|nr:DUF624 domain-containing protein [Micromonospora marina]SCF30695.1 Uncharacterized membrane protein YesL [Micromonospora marina]